MTIKVKAGAGTEQDLHKQVVQLLRLQYPNIMFYTTMDGVRLPIGLAKKAKRLRQPEASWPDLLIPEARGGYAGLWLELKRSGVRLFKKDGTPADAHIAEQWGTLQKLTQRGFKAMFVVGFDEAVAAIREYLASPE